MFRLLFPLFIIIPLIEIALFIKVGEAIGTANTLLCIVLTAILGVYFLRQQGFETLNRLQGRASRGEIPATELAEGACLLFAGALLLTPGFFTDGVGALLLWPYTRRAFISRIAKFVVPSVVVGGFGAGQQADGFTGQYSQERQQGGNQSTRSNNGDTIDGEYINETDAEERKKLD